MLFRATLNFGKFMVALNHMYRILLNFASSYILSCLSKFCDNKKKKNRRAVFVSAICVCKCRHYAEL